MRRRFSVMTTGSLQTDHIAALEALRSDVTVDRRCADLAELMAVAGLRRADAALIIGDADLLGQSLLEQLREHGLTVVVITDSEEQRHRLARCAVTVFDDDVSAEALADALSVHQPSIVSSQDAVDPVSEETPVLDPSGLQETRPGVLVVWGTSGAPGRTTVAVNLAAELALDGLPTLLIDADTHAAAVSVHLGLLEESAGLARLCRSADLGDLDAATFAQATVAVSVGDSQMDVLTGLPRSDRWPEIRPRALERVLETARGHYAAVVVDISSGIEEDEELSYDTQAPQRHGASLAVLRSADRVLALGGSDPVGFSRLLRCAEDHRSRLPEAQEPEFVVTRLRRSVVGRAPRRQLSQAWEELGPPRLLSGFLVWDPAVCDEALRRGQVLAEAASDSPLRHQIAGLVGISPAVRRRSFFRARRRREPHHGADRDRLDMAMRRP